MGSGQQHQIGLGQDPGHAVLVQRQQRLIEGPDPLGMQGREPLVGILTAGGDIEAEQFELWMVLYQCGQFGSRVATGTDDNGVKHVEYSKSEFEIHSMELQCTRVFNRPFAQVRRGNSGGCVSSVIDQVTEH